MSYFLGAPQLKFRASGAGRPEWAFRPQDMSPEQRRIFKIRQAQSRRDTGRADAGLRKF